MIGREEVRSYGGEVLTGHVTQVERIDDDRFRSHLVGGTTIVSRRVLAATGLVDELPNIEGLAERWGRDVIHCPYCHGYEVRDQRIVQIVTHPMGLHPAALFRQLTEHLTLVLHDGVGADDPQVDALRAAGVQVVDERARRLIVDAHGELTALELGDRTSVDADVVAVATRFGVRAEPLASLGLIPEPHPTGLGDHIATDATGATSVPGVYAAGNITDPSQQVLQAAANGSWVGGMISADLAHADIAAAARPSGNQLDWDHRYAGEQMWSGKPNGTLVAEVADLTPGRALDVGCGEGGDAIWLAERGWKVTASDISQRALERVTAEAERRDLAMTCLRADANGHSPFDGATFDLVSAQYASIPRTPDGRGIANLLAAVAPGGTLLAVGHDLEPMRVPVNPYENSRAFDPDSYVRIDDIAAALVGSADWDVEIHETRPRPPGAASSHHVDDVVLRARRR